MTVPAIFNKSGLKRGFYPCDTGEIDIAAKLTLIAAFEIKFFDSIVVDNDNILHVLSADKGGKSRVQFGAALYDRCVSAVLILSRLCPIN